MIRRRWIVSVLLIALLAAMGYWLTRGIYVWKTGSMWEGAIQCYYLTWTGISEVEHRMPKWFDNDFKLWCSLVAD